MSSCDYELRWEAQLKKCLGSYTQAQRLKRESPADVLSQQTDKVRNGYIPDVARR